MPANPLRLISRGFKRKPPSPQPPSGVSGLHKTSSTTRLAPSQQAGPPQNRTSMGSRPATPKSSAEMLPQSTPSGDTEGTGPPVCLLFSISTIIPGSKAALETVDITSLGAFNAESHKHGVRATLLNFKGNPLDFHIAEDCQTEFRKRAQRTWDDYDQSRRTTCPIGQSPAYNVKVKWNAKTKANEIRHISGESELHKFYRYSVGALQSGPQAVPRRERQRVVGVPPRAAPPLATNLVPSIDIGTDREQWSQSRFVPNQVKPFGPC